MKKIHELYPDRKFFYRAWGWFFLTVGVEFGGMGFLYLSVCEPPAAWLAPLFNFSYWVTRLDHPLLWLLFWLWLIVGVAAYVYIDRCIIEPQVHTWYKEHPYNKLSVSDFFRRLRWAWYELNDEHRKMARTGLRKNEKPVVIKVKGARHPCPWCHSFTPDDKFGNCSACGGTR